MEAVLVLGNPGCGKTYNLIQYVQNLTKKFDPQDITVLSHTRVAAKEIIERAGSNKVNASTIHSLAYRIAEISKESVVTNKEIREFSEGINIPMKGAGGYNDQTLAIGDEYMAVINFAEANCQPYSWAYKKKGMPGSSNEFEYFYKNYHAWKDSYGFIDFNDMLTQATKSKVTQHIPALLIDEAQDLSLKQWGLIDKISENTKFMLVTGDPDQALFIWGGASSQYMTEWGKRVGAKIEHLSQSYRVPRKVCKLSKKILQRVSNRYEKDYKPTKLKGHIDKYLTTIHYDFKNLNEALILYRNHALRKSIEEQLIFANKAYVTLNGIKGLCQNKYGLGVRAWLNIRKKGSLDSRDFSAVRTIATPLLSNLIVKNDLEGIMTIEPIKALNIPYQYFNYYRNVNFDEVNKIKLSTIHGAKGMEHDKIILINGMTQRVVEEAMVDLDQELAVWYVAVTRTKNHLIIIDGEGEGRLL